MSYYENNQPRYITSTPPAYVGVEFEIIARSDQICTDPDDICEPTVQTFLVEPKRVQSSFGADARDIGSVVAQHFAPPYCYCEHDCCGHRFGLSEFRWLTMDRIEVTVGTARNY